MALDGIFLGSCCLDGCLCPVAFLAPLADGFPTGVGFQDIGSQLVVVRDVGVVHLGIREDGADFGRCVAIL